MKFQKQLTGYLEKRIKQFEELGPLLELYGVGRGITAEQANLHRLILKDLQAGASAETIAQKIEESRHIERGRTGSFSETFSIF